MSHYGELNLRLRRVHERIAENNAEMRAVLDACYQQPLLTDEFVTALAAQLRFQDAWLTISEARAKAKCKAKAGQATPNQAPEPDRGQITLPELMAAGNAAPVVAMPPPPVPVRAVVANAVVAKAEPLAPSAMAAAPTAPGPLVLPPAGGSPPAHVGVPPLPKQSAQVPLAPQRSYPVALDAMRVVGKGGPPAPKSVVVTKAVPATPAANASQSEAGPLAMASAMFGAENVAPDASNALEDEQLIDELVEGTEANEANHGATAESTTLLRASDIVEAVESEAEANHVDTAEEDPNAEVCSVCQQVLRPKHSPQLALFATACGHVHHRYCLEKTWSPTIGKKPRGWCPLKCLSERSLMTEDGWLVVPDAVGDAAAGSSAFSSEAQVVDVEDAAAAAADMVL